MRWGWISLWLAFSVTLPLQAQAGVSASGTQVEQEVEGTLSVSDGRLLVLTVEDIFANQDSAAIDTIVVSLVTSAGDLESLYLVETGVNRGVFTGSVGGSLGEARPEDGVLQVEEGGSAQFNYVVQVDETVAQQWVADVQVSSGVESGPTDGRVGFVPLPAAVEFLESVSAGETCYLFLADGDANRDSGEPERVRVEVATSEGDAESIVLTESGRNTGVFRASLVSEIGLVIVGDGVAQVSVGGSVRVSYKDAVDASGRFDVRRTAQVQVLGGDGAGVEGRVYFADGSGGSLAVFSPGDSVGVVVLDGGLSGSSVSVRLSSSEGDEEGLVLGLLSTGRYEGRFSSSAGAGQSGDGVLQVGGGGLVEVVYEDTSAGLVVRRRAQVSVLGGGAVDAEGQVYFADGSGSLVTVFSAGDSVGVVVLDGGLSGTSVSVRLSSSEGDEEGLVLGLLSTGRYGGRFSSSAGAGQSGDGVLQVGGGGLVGVVYEDTVDGLMVPRRAQVSVEAPNHAPVVDSVAVFTLDSILEDDPAPLGNTVGDLVARAGDQALSDVDAGPLGMAVVGVDTLSGAWEYSPDGEAPWKSLAPIDETSALLLDYAAAIRFVPARDFNGQVLIGLLFRAWDQTTGQAGDRVDVRDKGGRSAFSQNAAALRATVTPVNDPPVTVADSLVVEQGTTRHLELAANDFDVDRDSLRVVGVSSALQGTLATEGDTIRYRAPVDYEGEDRFTYTVEDAAGVRVEGQVVVMVTPMARPAISLTTTVDRETTQPGDTLTCTLKYHNLGTGLAREVDIAADFPPGTGLVPQSVLVNGELGSDAEDGDGVRVGETGLVVRLDEVLPGVEGVIQYRLVVH